MLVEKLTDISLRLSNSSSLGGNINPQKSIILVMYAKLSQNALRILRFNNNFLS